MARRTVPTAAVVGGFDLTDLDNFTRGFPHDAFARHRAEAPVLWHEPTEHTPDGEGFWSVATHAETLQVLRDPVAFSSERGGDRPYGGTILPDSAIAGKVLNMTDDPRHQRVRRLVSKGLTPRVIGRLEAELRSRSRALLERASGLGECDFVETVAGELPMQAICMLLGIPEGDRHRLFTWIEHSFDFRDRDYMEPTDEVVAAMAELHAYGTQLIEEKRARPRDDMLSVVVHAELPDEYPSRLTDEELQLFFSLLFAAGADTTRHATAGGVLALAECPAQYDALRHDRSLLATATEEIVRWSSPAAYNRRTATSDIELGGLPVRPGDKVVFWEASANRDETVFPDATSFDVRRDPNPHVGFGHGVHHCLGASLARLELRVVLDEVLDRFDAIEPAGTPEWTRSNKHTGIRCLPVRLTSGAAS